jgi:hypothetical protein
MTPSPALTATVTVSPGAAEPLCRTLLPKISLTSKTATSPHGCPGPSTSLTNERALPHPQRQRREPATVPSPQPARNPLTAGTGKSRYTGTAPRLTGSPPLTVNEGAARHRSTAAPFPPDDPGSALTGRGCQLRQSRSLRVSGASCSRLHDPGLHTACREFHGRQQPGHRSSARCRRQRKHHQPDGRHPGIGIPSAATASRHRNPERRLTLGTGRKPLARCRNGARR